MITAHSKTGACNTLDFPSHFPKSLIDACACPPAASLNGRLDTLSVDQAVSAILRLSELIESNESTCDTFLLMDPISVPYSSLVDWTHEWHNTCSAHHMQVCPTYNDWVEQVTQTPVGTLTPLKQFFGDEASSLFCRQSSVIGSAGDAEMHQYTLSQLHEMTLRPTTKTSVHIWLECLSKQLNSGGQKM